MTGENTARGTWAMFDFVEWPPTDGGARVGITGYGHYVEEYRPTRTARGASRTPDSNV